jgi:hypothetical protein
MKTLFHIFLLSILAGEIVALYFVSRPKPQNKVLGGAVVSTPTPFLTPVPTPILTPSPKPTPVKTPKPTPIPQPKFTSQQINEFIDRFSGQYGVSPDVMRYIALCESGFNPSAQNLGYAGLFQFDSTTWKNLRLKMGEDVNINLRFNAEEAVQTAAYAISISDRGIWPHCYP